MKNTIRVIVILAMIALFLPVFSGYVMAFTMLVLQLLPVWRRQTSFKDNRLSGSTSLFQYWHRGIVVMLTLLIFVSVVTGIQNGSGEWRDVVRFVGNAIVKYGLLWIFMQGFWMLSVRYFNVIEFAMGVVAPVTVVHFLYCLAQRYWGIDWVHGFNAVLPANRFAYGVYRVSGFTSHPLTIGYQLCLIMVLGLALALTRCVSQTCNRLGLCTAIFAWLTILISGSRGPLMVSSMAAAWMLLPFLNKHKLWSIVGIAIACGGVLALPGTNDRFREAVTGNSGDTRFMDLKVYATAFFENPWFGIGPMGFRQAISAYYERFGGNDTIGLAHNIYLQVAAESGLIGLAGMLGWIAAWPLTGVRLPRTRERWMFCALVIVMCASGVTQNSLRDSSVLYTLTVVTMMLVVLFSDDASKWNRHESNGAKDQNFKSGAGA